MWLCPKISLNQYPSNFYTMPPENSNGQYKLSIESRITRLETVVEEIKTNHLVHIERKLSWGVALLITTLVSVIVSLTK